ncbi:CPBP family intramembrane glutamic endopeptidase [Bradymonas sediminis]|uniref:CPBP family intramembrane metalloprotease n=1 Tax=Bradymonas sediminis TaxID=1548548 RepID=A0A2Z4FG81_9DELT|nr:CPBP family intramembrane glutamic endopeptidase [Bradymonas sediminis]AWV87933.1 CPBP family intramembrane metalloprotease [Bradymonas sediminis]TDP62951.1 CAAX prenyl protease-like protein [Bradymonas sediminis]
MPPSIKNTLQRCKTDFMDAFEQVENDSFEWLAENRRRVDWRLLGLVALACFVLSFLEYFGGSGKYTTLQAPLSLFVDNANERIIYTFRTGEYARLARLMYWSGCTFVGYMLIPALYVKFVMGERLRDMGLSLKGALKHWWIYVGLFLIVLPFVYLMSLTDSFQNTYPFYKLAGRSPAEFVVWELTYALQFMSLEFFFRGVLLHATKKRFGIYSVLLSVIPYCMIHFGKPLPETLGAVFAGIALGVLSLYTRSIWLGVAIHVSVAVAMDVFALLARGEFHLF